MAQKGFDETAKTKELNLCFKEIDKRFDKMDDRFDKIEKLILADHKRRIEKLEKVLLLKEPVLFTRTL